MDEPRSFDEAQALLGTRARHRLMNNTTLELGLDSIVVILHDTVVVRFYPDGRIQLRMGGWNTLTTRNRLNRYTPQGWNVWSDTGACHTITKLFAPDHRHAYIFEDGITIHPDSTVTGAGTLETYRYGGIEGGGFTGGYALY